MAAIIALAVVTPGLGAAGLPNYPYPCTSTENTVLHVHPYLRITILGKSVTIPAAIGIPSPVYQSGVAVSGRCFEPMHTHDASGIIHIEAPDPTHPYTLGQFFQIWADTYKTVQFGGKARPVVYTPTDLLGYKAGGGNVVTLLVDGKPSTTGPGLVLNYLDYCSAKDTAATSPCALTAGGDPVPPSIFKKYGTGHTVVLEYGPPPKSGG